jgi:oxygen-independent coproporphyrinogen-3 oxidase
VDTVYFGGGTPSYLGAKRLEKILRTVFKRFGVAKDAEITLEANPDSAGDRRELKRLRKAGFNRLSLGMQSADGAELLEIGRIHTPADCRRRGGGEKGRL